MAENFHLLRVHWKGIRTTTVCPDYGDVHYGFTLVGVVLCARSVEHDEVTFSAHSITVQWQERLA